MYKTICLNNHIDQESKAGQMYLAEHDAVSPPLDDEEEKEELLQVKYYMHHIQTQ